VAIRQGRRGNTVDGEVARTQAQLERDVEKHRAVLTRRCEQESCRRSESNAA
jgi:hypothetical protein